ncbi:hypothetical protein HOC80_04660 [archaeon]|jgi:hypothetical protein|nr:hypothetical protein [archaeon]MBT4417365.1 hypothetical protein [archaeon]
MVTQYVEYLIPSKGSKKYTAGVAIINRPEGTIIYLDEIFEIETNLTGRPLDILNQGKVRAINHKPNSEISFGEPTLSGIAQAEYQAVVNKSKRKECA